MVAFRSQRTSLLVVMLFLAIPQIAIAKLRGIRFPEDFQSARSVTRAIVAGYDKDRIRFTKVSSNEPLELKLEPQEGPNIEMQSWPSAGTEVVVVTTQTDRISLFGERHEAGWLFRDPTLPRGKSRCDDPKDRSLDGCFISDAQLAAYLK
jgi:hypothetical protein